MTIADVVYQWLEKLMQADRERARDYEGWKVEQRARRRERKREKLLKGKVVIAQPESIKRKRRVVEIKKVDKAEQKKIYNAQKIFGYVYLMRSDNGFHKIGLSKNIKVRLNGLKSQFPVDIGVIHYFACHDCRKVEKLLHKKYEGKRAQREWFILNESDVRWITSLKDYELD